MGRLNIETLPKITITIAITIAKIGRSIKNLAISVPHFLASGFFSVGPTVRPTCGTPASRAFLMAIGRSPHAVRYGIYDVPRHRLLDSFNNDAVSGFESLGHNPAFTHAFCSGDRPRLHLVFRPNDQNGLKSLQFLYGALRHKNDVLTIFDPHAKPAKLARKKSVIRVLEDRLDLNRSGLRIDLIDGVLHAPFTRISQAIGKNELNGNIPIRC